MLAAKVFENGRSQAVRLPKIMESDFPLSSINDYVLK